jgi:hypothetical protein
MSDEACIVVNLRAVVAVTIDADVFDDLVLHLVLHLVLVVAVVVVGWVILSGVKGDAQSSEERRITTPPPRRNPKRPREGATSKKKRHSSSIAQEEYPLRLARAVPVSRKGLTKIQKPRGSVFNQEERVKEGPQRSKNKAKSQNPAALPNKSQNSRAPPNKCQNLRCLQSP